MQLEKLSFKTIMTLVQSSDCRDWFRALDASEKWQPDIPFEIVAPLLDKPNVHIWRRTIRLMGRCHMVEPLVHLCQDGEANKAVAALEQFREFKLQIPEATFLAAFKRHEYIVQEAALLALATHSGDNVLIEKLWRTLERSNRRGTAIAVNILGAWDDIRGLDYIVAAVNDPDKYVREAACSALALHAKELDPAVLVPLLHDPEDEVRREAKYAFLSFGDRVPVGPVLSALLEQGDIEFEDPLVAALGKLGAAFPRNELVTLAYNDDPFAHEVAAAIMDEMGADAPIDLLLHIIEQPLSDTEYNSRVRGRAIAALGKTQRREVLPRLLAMLQNVEEQQYYGSVAGAIGTFGQRGTIPLLLTLLAGENNSYEFEDILRGMAGFGEDIPVDALIAFFENHRDNYYSEFLMSTLGHAGRFVPVDFLINVMQAPELDVFIREAAAFVLAELGDRVPLDVILTALHDKEVQVSAAIAEGLGKTGDAKYLPNLVSLIQDDDTPMWAGLGAISGLGKLAKAGINIPVEPLLAILDATADERRKYALRTLSNCGDRAASDVFIYALNDSYLQDWAAQLLREHQSAALEDAAQEALAIIRGEASQGKWIAATLVIGVIKASRNATPAMIDRLLELTYFPANQIRERAVIAISFLPLPHTETISRRLQEMQRDPAINVRQAVVKVLGLL